MPTLRQVAGLAVSGEAPRATIARSFVRGALRLGPKGGGEPELPADIPTLGSRLREAGYTVAYKGKWHLTMPLAGHGNWGPADAERLERDFGFPGWEPPDAGENTDPAGFGGGNAGASQEGFDEDYIRQAERFLAGCRPARAVLPHRLAGQPARRARLPVVLRDRRLRARAVRGPGRSTCRRPSTRTCATSRPRTRC